jgi:hypothetical protein
MSALWDAVRENDLEELKRLIAEGVDVAEANLLGFTALLKAAGYGRLPIMHWLLTEGGPSLVEESMQGRHALAIAALNGRFPTMQYLLEERGASMSESDNRGRTVWDNIKLINLRGDESGELSSLLKIIVMLEDAPPDFIIRLSPEHADICARGRQLWAQLPSYLEQQRAVVVAHCPLPAVLQSIIATYTATTPEDMWAYGLRVQTP